MALKPNLLLVSLNNRMVLENMIRLQLEDLENALSTTEEDEDDIR